jgi:hypothetical protein
MQIGQAYTDVLPETHRLALQEAADELIDTTISDLAAGGYAEWSEENWFIGGLLPQRYVLKCSQALHASSSPA